jgi:hypothetical protein
MKTLLSCLLLAAALTLAPTGQGRAASLCGTHYKSRSDLAHVLQAQGGRVFAGKAMHSVLVTSSGALWWITTRVSHAYPAIACVQKPSSDGGSVPRKAEADCRGASPTACRTLRRQIAKAKF